LVYLEWVIVKWQPAKTKRRKRASIKFDKGAVVELLIEDLNSRGEGVGRYEGKVVFVPGVWVGEQVSAKILHDFPSHVVAELQQVLGPSAARRKSPCIYHGFDSSACGGCPWMIVTYQAQIEAKRGKLQDLALRLGFERTVEFIAAPEEFGYRNRAQFKATYDALGFVAANSDQVVDVESCLILSEHNQALLTQLRLQDFGLGKRRKRWLTLDVADGLPLDQVGHNQRLPFQQGNSQQNARMQQWLRSALVDLDKTVPVLELFAGSGNFTSCLVDLGFAQITAVEVVDAALEELAEAHPSVATLKCDLFDAPRVSEMVSRYRDVGLLVLDPPRDGFTNLADTIALLPQLERLIYISCDSASFERDVDCLKGTFELRDFAGIDLYPQTPHVEILSCWSRISK
jgi:23S rRNA (uracil1939-C5)-methyltransferase